MTRRPINTLQTLSADQLKQVVGGAMSSFTARVALPKMPVVPAR